MNSLSNLLESSQASLNCDADGAETVNITVSTEDSRVQANKKHISRRGGKRKSKKPPKTAVDSSSGNNSNNNSSDEAEHDADEEEARRRRHQEAMYQQHIKLMGQKHLFQ
ncbi:hypothetical protein ACA910_019220 [Epithemia clementina (nom. ined.)]